LVQARRHSRRQGQRLRRRPCWPCQPCPPCPLCAETRMCARRSAPPQTPTRRCALPQAPPCWPPPGSMQACTRTGGRRRRAPTCEAPEVRGRARARLGRKAHDAAAGLLGVHCGPREGQGEDRRAQGAAVDGPGVLQRGAVHHKAALLWLPLELPAGERDGGSVQAAPQQAAARRTRSAPCQRLSYALPPEGVQVAAPAVCQPLGHVEPAPRRAACREQQARSRLEANSGRGTAAPTQRLRPPGARPRLYGLTRSSGRSRPYSPQSMRRWLCRYRSSSLPSVLAESALYAGPSKARAACFSGWLPHSLYRPWFSLRARPSSGGAGHLVQYARRLGPPGALSSGSRTVRWRR